MTRNLEKLLIAYSLFNNKTTNTHIRHRQYIAYTKTTRPVNNLNHKVKLDNYLSLGGAVPKGKEHDSFKLGVFLR